MGEPMIDTMKAAARVVNCAQELVSEAHRSILDDEAHIPADVFNRLVDAVNQFDAAATHTGEDEDGPTRNQRFTRLCR